MADIRMVVVVAAEWFDPREEEAWDMDWASLSLLAARAAWVVARRVASLVAAWAPWLPAVPVVSWLLVSLSAALKWSLNVAHSLVVVAGSNWRHSQQARSYRPVLDTM
jgi:hypothetical protein